MPGRIMENGIPEPGPLWQQPLVDGSPLKQDHRAAGVNGAAKEKRDQGNAMVNGGSGSLESMLNGHSLDHAVAATTNEVATMESGASRSGDAPPEIEHITFGYQQMSTLTARLVQETFNNLKDVINDLAEPPLSQSSKARPSPEQMNGHGGVNGAGDDSPANIHKKTQLMNFAQHRRAQFIKLLVLNQWSRQSAEVSRVIDLKIWLDKQRSLYDEAWFWLGDLKRSLGPARMPNPDIHTALEALSTGKASGLPDLGYIPPKPLTPQKMLKCLRNMNALLTLRLRLHDTLPPQFQSYTIESGRVTFAVLDEFEVDLSIADEDPASQFFFIDFRFKFSPSPSELLAGRRRNDLEAKVNDVLRTEGLTGCYHFLHEFVLTHKINILRRQAVSMSTDKWSESIRLETVRRSLIVQYWPNRIGPKSWIEIGISSGRSKVASVKARTAPTSQISVRWFSDGKLADSAPIAMNLAHLSMESTLRNVIALHTNRIFSSIRTKLAENKLYGERALSLEQMESKTEPGDCQLRVQLTPSTTATLTMEPITGRFALLPASALFNSAEAQLNGLKEPALDAWKALANLRCVSVVEEVESRARAIGMEAWKTLNPKQEDLRRIFPRDTLRVSYFRRNGWRKNWIVAMSVGMSGEIWWIIEILETSPGYEFGNFQRIPITSVTGKVVDPSYDFLSRLSVAAAGMISHFTNVQALHKMGVKYALRRSESGTESARHVPALIIHFSSLMSRAGKPRWKVWAKEPLKVTCQSVRLATGQIIMVTEAKLLNLMPQFDLVKDRVEDEIVFHPRTGAFAFRLVTPMGESIIHQLVERLQRIESLISFLEILRRCRLKCETVSLGRIVYIYSEQPNLKAELVFAGGAPMTISLPNGNPHLRIRDFLAKILNGQDGLERVTFFLGITLPLLLALDQIERDHAQDDVFILTRAAAWFQLRYEHPRCAFDIRLRQRRDELRWYIREDPSVASPARSPFFSGALKNVMNESGDGWISLRTGIAADVKGVAEVVRGIDRLLKEHAQDRAAGAEERPEEVERSTSTRPGEVVTIPD